MGARSHHACYSVNNYVTVAFEGQKFSLRYSQSLTLKNGNQVYLEIIEKSALYSICKRLSKEVIKRGINVDEIDSLFGNSFSIVKHEGNLYQMQSTSTKKENLILEDFRQTEFYKKIISDQ